MTDVATPQQRLSKAVRERRTELGLSVRAACKLAGISRNTWAALEDGTRVTQDRHYGDIERALRWPTGHILSILDSDTTPRALPTDAEVAAMDAHGLATHYVRIDREQGRAEALDWFTHAVKVWSHAQRPTPAS